MNIYESTIRLVLLLSLGCFLFPSAFGFAIPTDRKATLMEMDVVVYSETLEAPKRLGAVQESGLIAPLSIWTTEPAYRDSLEFVVDEVDLHENAFDREDIIVHSLVEEVDYGSRQVGGGKGPGNPHGEESEITYYIDQVVWDNVELVLKPELEIQW